jgi:hypothetical protein
MPVLKLFLFPLFVGMILLAGYMSYVFFNDKINGSRTLLALVFYALSFIAVCIGLIMGGLMALAYVARWLS